MNLKSWVRILILRLGIDVLMILCYLFGCDGRSCYVFLALDRGVMELLSYNEQTSRELLPVGRIIADKKGILTLRDNELRDVHSGKGRVINAEI